MFTPKLQWIDEADPESIKQSRIHRQKEFHRAKRWKQVRQWQSQKKDVQNSVVLAREQSSSSSSQDGVSEAGSRALQDSPLLKDENSVLNGEDTAAHDEALSRYSPSEAGQVARSQAPIGEDLRTSWTRTSRDAHPGRTARTTPVLEANQLLDLLASSRRDPFGTLPFAGSSDAWSNQLVSHCKSFFDVYMLF